MASVSSTAESKTGNNQFLRIVAAISTLSGWLSAGMIMLSVLITCQMIFIRFVLNIGHGVSPGIPPCSPLPPEALLLVTAADREL